jgi:hypothetical protein
LGVSFSSGTGKNTKEEKSPGTFYLLDTAPNDLDKLKRTIWLSYYFLPQSHFHAESKEN